MAAALFTTRHPRSMNFNHLSVIKFSHQDIFGIISYEPYEIASLYDDISSLTLTFYLPSCFYTTTYDEYLLRVVVVVYFC
jgi:hypothetical protein